MSRLRIFDEVSPEVALSVYETGEDISRELGVIGVRFERWAVNGEIEPGASQEDVIAAYHGDIERLRREQGYQAVDVISLTPDHPDRASLRKKFLSEHTHSEDEVRFFVAGSGQFTLRVDGRVYDVLCEQGDLIGVPDGIRHWFDMSEAPFFVAIRLFTNAEGWIAAFTGDDIALRFPRMMPTTTARSISA